LLAATVSCGIDLSMGALAGYAGGRDGLLMRLVDLTLALPTFFLLIVVQALLPLCLLTIALIIALTRWMALARLLVRGQFLSLKERDFVQAARTIGCSAWRIVFRHLLPNTSSQIAVFFTLALADAILIKSALSFLGLGLPPSQPSWGSMLADGRASVLAGTWWVALFPGLMILLMTLTVNLLGDGIQTALRAFSL